MNRKISVIGLGYVGLPMAVAFAKEQQVIAFDVNVERINELKNNIDYTGEINTEKLSSFQLYLTANAADLKRADFHIIAVPTPINKAKHPDLTMLLKATEIVGQNLKPNDVVVYESTVYPGVTEEECVPILEQSSKLKCGKDFFVGYSPERINPGDKEHTFTNIQKIVAGQNQATLDIIAEVYGQVITAGVYKASSIKVAEAAKVIENTQRDINIALVNELALIFEKLGLDTAEVLAAAETKWNFLPFRPGLVGGHCIGVDPYYLTYKANMLGLNPQVILSGRRINDNMGKYIAEQTIKQLVKLGKPINSAKVAILGLTFKENCPDIRNSKVVDIINELESYHVNVQIHDPLAKAKQALAEYNLALQDWSQINNADAIILAVPHKFYLTIPIIDIINKLTNPKLIIDVKSILDKKELQKHDITVWRL